VIAILKNPFYAGAYIYGKTEHRTALVEGRVRKTYHHDKPIEQWEVMIKDHHEGYIAWDEYERNQTMLAANAYRRVGGVKSGRGGRALLPGLLLCGHCGRRLMVAYTGRAPGHPVYRCERAHQMLGRTRCLTFGAARVEQAMAAELVRAVEPLAVEAAMEADRRYRESHVEQRRLAELELTQARYEASLAERRYAACDPDHRLIAAQLEKSWEAALQRVKGCEARCAALATADGAAPPPDFTALADDLGEAWNAPGVTMRARQQLVRTLIAGIVANYQADTRELVLTIHWKGGQHSELRVKKPQSGEHGCRTSEEAIAVIRTMATRWSDEDIAATLNRLRLPTGQGKTWTAHRVASLRRVRGIHAYRSAEKRGEWLTLSDAAATLGVSHHQIRRLIKGGILAAEQVVPDAPYQIRAADLHDARVTVALANKGRPRRPAADRQRSMFSDT
jgi:hypothetical protein